MNVGCSGITGRMILTPRPSGPRETGRVAQTPVIRRIAQLSVHTQRRRSAGKIASAQALLTRNSAAEELAKERRRCCDNDQRKTAPFAWHNSRPCGFERTVNSTKNVPMGGLHQKARAGPASGWTRGSTIRRVLLQIFCRRSTGRSSMQSLIVDRSSRRRHLRCVSTGRARFFDTEYCHPVDRFVAPKCAK